MEEKLTPIMSVGVFFRGQLTKYKTMNPTIARDKSKLHIENQIFEKYKKR